MGQLGAGAGLLLGSAKARAPTFADPGTPTPLRLVEPLLRPAIGVEWALADGWALSASAFVRVALLTHVVNLPATFAEVTEAPLVTDRAQPGLAIGLRWAPFAGPKKQ